MTLFSIHIIQNGEIVHMTNATPREDLESEARNLPWELVTEKADVRFYNLETNEYEPIKKEL